MKSRAENAFYIVFIVFLGFWVRQSMILTSRKATEYDVGVNFFPLVLSSGMLILTVYLLVKNIWMMKRASDEQQEIEEPKTSRQRFLSVLSFFLVFFLLLLYILLLDPLGFGLATFIFLIIMNLMLNHFTHGHFIGLKPFAIRIITFAVFSFGLPYIFRHVFRLILP